MDDPSLTVAAVTNAKVPEIWNLVHKYSSLSKLIRITIYILRFERRIISKTSFASRIWPVIGDFQIHDSPHIIGAEIRQAKILWSYLTQRLHISKEFELLKTKQSLPRGHYLKNLKRIVGDVILTYEEFATLLCQVEACLNSRPLVPLTEDASDLLVLTPAHFLIREPSFLIAEPRNTDEVIPPLLRWLVLGLLVLRLPPTTSKESQMEGDSAIRQSWGYSADPP